MLKRGASENSVHATSADENGLPGPILSGDIFEPPLPPRSAISGSVHGRGIGQFQNAAWTRPARSIGRNHRHGIGIQSDHRFANAPARRIELGGLRRQALEGFRIEHDEA